MKKIIMLIVTLLGAMTASAQIATLSHEGQISAFYGENSLIEAMDAATHGDIISLSSGRFNATNITKRVTLRGTGMSSSSDPNDMYEATVIVGTSDINLPDTLSETLMLTMESLYFNDNVTISKNLKKAQFTKCRFNSFGSIQIGNPKKQDDVSFTHCRVTNSFSAGSNSQITFLNCIVQSPTITSGYVNFNNCVIKYSTNNFSYVNVNNRFKNCIIHLGSQNGNLASNYTASHCIGVCGSSTMFDNLTTGNTTNTYVSDITSVFKTYSNTISNVRITDSDDFELTETAAQTYLGEDGTQVGIFGGVLPYDERPLNPKITKCNVASKTTADGKLSVDIEVSAAGY